MYFLHLFAFVLTVHSAAPPTPSNYEYLGEGECREEGGQYPFNLERAYLISTDPTQTFCPQLCEHFMWCLAYTVRDSGSWRLCHLATDYSHWMANNAEWLNPKWGVMTEIEGNKYKMYCRGGSDTCKETHYGKGSLNNRAGYYCFKRKTFPQTSTSTPTTTSPQGSVFTSQGSGKCKNPDGSDPTHEYVAGVGLKGCEGKCVANNECSGFSASMAGNCLLWLQPNIIGGGDQWGGAKCFLRTSGPSSTSAPSSHCANWFGNNLNWNNIPFERVGNTPWGLTPNGCNRNAVETYGAYHCAERIDGAFQGCDGDCANGACVRATSTTTIPTTKNVVTGSLCSAFQCGEDAMHKPLASSIDGNSFEACCECTYVASNHVFLGTFMEGDFDKESRKLSLSFDLPGDVKLESVVWNGAQDDSLSFAKGLWKNSNVNSCRVRYEINEGLAQLFGGGSHFSLSGTTLTSSIQIEASTNIHERGQSFDRTYSESVPILVGLETTATVDATFHMKHQDIPEKVDITGNAENFATDGSVVLTMMVTTPGCIRHTGAVTTGMEHITDPEFTFGEKNLVNNLCKQEVQLKFNPVKAFTDTLEVQFVTRQGNQFSIEIDVNIQAGSILDYLPFDASMTFHADGAFNDDPQTEFLLGEEVYTSIVVSPLINLPLSHIEINTFTLTQTGYSGERETTDMMKADWAKFNTNALPENKQITAEFELESTHFHVSKDGELCDIKADITIQYQDGVTIRRQLTARRRLSTQNAANSFRIVDHLSSESMVSLMFKPENSFELGIASLFSIMCVACFILKIYGQRQKDEMYRLIDGELTEL